MMIAMDEMDKLGRRLNAKIERGGSLSALNPIPKNRQEFIYLLRCVGFDYYKIGKAGDVEVRRSAIQTSCPFEIELMACKKVDKVQRLERAFHKQLKKRKIRGEWFELTEEEASRLAKSILSL